MMHQLLHFFAVRVAFGLSKARMGIMQDTSPMNMVRPSGAGNRMDKVHARPFFLGAIQKDFLGFFRKFFPGCI